MKKEGEERVKSPPIGGGDGEGEGALPSVIPYLKQLEDYRHHKVCSTSAFLPFVVLTIHIVGSMHSL